MNQSFRAMLYAGATTRIIGHYMPWHNGKHTVDPSRKEGYRSDDPAAVTNISVQLQDGGFDVLSPNWYGQDAPYTYENTCTSVLLANSVLKVATCIDGACFTSLTQLRSRIAYMRAHHFTSPNYETHSGKYLVTHFFKPGNQQSWFTTVAAENPDILFVTNETSWGGNLMAWVQSDLEANADWWIRTFGLRGGTLNIPCVAAGFNDLNSLTGIGVWGANPARIWPPGVPGPGPNWDTLRAFFAAINRYYSTSNQLPYLQAVTVNDADEGTNLLRRGFILPVNAAQPTATLSDFPSLIVAGQSSTLTWTTTNATSASIDNGIGAATPVAGGSVVVTPVTTTTYTITATGPGGTITAQATVTVVPGAPTASLTSVPENINLGQSSTLYWNSTNATSTTIDNGVGAVQPVAGGSIVVQPLVTTTYTLTATGPGGSVMAVATVTVGNMVYVPPPAPMSVVLAGAPVQSALLEGPNLARNWMKWFQAIVTAFNSPIPGPYANDAAAGAAGVQIGAQYYQSSGAVVTRLA